MDLNGIKMNVTETDPDGVVNHETIFEFTQENETVTASYSGGKIEKGFLVGALKGSTLNFSYCQKQTDGTLDNGISECEVSKDGSGKIQLTEHFEWKSRPGVKGKNVFKEL